jgi:hypothetical protein
MPIHHVTYAMPNARDAQKKAIHMLHKELHHQLRKPTTHTKLTKDRLLEGRQKGSTPPAKEQWSTKLTSSP